MDPITFYFAATVGLGESVAQQSTDPELLARTYSVARADSRSTVFGAALGARSGLFAMEVGGLKLPTYKGYAEALMPARSASQSIKGEAYFARMLLYATQSWVVQPYVFGGAAYAIGRNHEQGQCATCGAGYVPDWHSETRAVVPYYGLGADVRLTNNLKLRAELGKMPHAVDSPWTGRRDYTFGTLSAIWEF